MKSNVRRFTQTENFEIVAESIGAESGKGADALNRRP
jgi:hypothetical protein